MKYLIVFLFPTLLLAQANMQIPESEYKRRVDNLFNLRSILLDQGNRGINIGDFKKDIVKNKNLVVLEQLEALELQKQNEKSLEQNSRLNNYEEKYLAKKYLKSLVVETLNTEEKKLEFFKAIKTLLERD